MSLNFDQLIHQDPQICGGQPVVRGTRVTLKTILASLAEGATTEEIVADFPTVTPQQVRDVISFAAASAQDDLPISSVPAVR